MRFGVGCGRGVDWRGDVDVDVVEGVDVDVVATTVFTIAWYVPL